MINIMGAVLSYIQTTNRIHELVNRKIYGRCYDCKKNISLNEEYTYYYKIIGLGKHNNKIICQNCLKNKFIKYIV